MMTQGREIKTIYLMGIGGIAMGTLATMLKEKGYQVVGSDQNLYPPMSLHLDALQIPLFQGYRAENLRQCNPDMVVIGNVIRRDNPEAQFVMEQGIPYLSMPQAIERFFLVDQKSIVITGTHGKSTTSALASWVLSDAGRDPSAFIGAFLKNWQYGYRIGKGPYMVLEGDEYDTAFFDKGPKFLHYRPHIGVITSIEFDHADIFRDFDAVLEAFRRFAKIIPDDGYLIINADDPNCRLIAQECSGRVVTYSCKSSADWQLVDVEYGRERVQFTYQDLALQRRSFISGLAGRHNIGNMLSVLAVASIAGLTHEEVQHAVLSFQGVRRRQDIVGERRGVIIMDDFAHHPTAVRETIQAMRLFYPDRRLVAAFEPRTNSSRRNVFENAYASSFDEADLVCIKEPPDMDKIPENERLNVGRLVEKISRRGKEAHLFENTPDLIQYMLGACAPGDLVLCMSNGSFDGLPHRLLEAFDGQQSRVLAAHK